ncbi:hypothetical protein Pcinc_007416 [Petrolisthes cinctipes]|uniref:Uncharacterized protein n=1 Tax=Petrolisthes cinctipes TaxID=88211 RepID=A0AAE1KXG2_PETCI|nr:hypothetical protein Pcinc_007416 [Petrolisthes cinctipes]
MAEVREGMSQEEEITEEEMVFTPRGKPVFGETSERGTGLLVDAMSQLADQLRDVTERLRELEQVQQPSSRPNTLPINTVVLPPRSPTPDPNPSSVSVVPPQQTGSPNPFLKGQMLGSSLSSTSEESLVELNKKLSELQQQISQLTSPRSSSQVPYRRDQLIKRGQIVALHEAGHSIRSIARRLGVSPTTVTKWINRNEETGDLTDLGKKV